MFFIKNICSINRTKMIEKYAFIKAVTKIIEEDREMSIRDIAKKAKISVSTAKETIDFLLKENILKKKIVGKSYLISLNKEDIITKQIKVLYSLIGIKKSRLVEGITKRYPEIISIILYGSVAEGTDDAKSDIDILIIARNQIKVSWPETYWKLGREINLLAFTLREWKELAKKDKVFYDRVVYNCINLYGEKPVVL